MDRPRLLTAIQMGCMVLYMSNDNVWRDDENRRVRINDDGTLTVLDTEPQRDEMPRIGQEVSITGWGSTVKATVENVRPLNGRYLREAEVRHPEQGTLVFTLRRSGTWVLKGFAETYAPEMKPSWP